jgi:hypothetical protein
MVIDGIDGSNSYAEAEGMLRVSHSHRNLVLSQS